MTELAGIILAAGPSSRLGRPKQMIRLHGETLVQRLVKVMYPLVVDLAVVLGAEAESVGESLYDQPVRMVRNPAWEQGMGTSLAAGANALPEDVDGVLVALCDQYRITEQDLFELIDAWKETPRRIVASRWEGAFGPPAIFPQHCFEELAMLAGDRGARYLIESPDQNPRFVPLDNASFDLDTPADLKTLRQRGGY